MKLLFKNVTFSYQKLCHINREEKRRKKSFMIIKLFICAPPKNCVKLREKGKKGGGPMGHQNTMLSQIVRLIMRYGIPKFTT